MNDASTRHPAVPIGLLLTASSAVTLAMPSSAVGPDVAREWRVVGWAAMAMLLVVAALAASWIRRRASRARVDRRRRAGRCPTCGYELPSGREGAAGSLRCPECGLVDAPAAAAPPAGRGLAACGLAVWGLWLGLGASGMGPWLEMRRDTGGILSAFQLRAGLGAPVSVPAYEAGVVVMRRSWMGPTDRSLTIDWRRIVIRPLDPAKPSGRGERELWWRPGPGTWHTGMDGPAVTDLAGDLQGMPGLPPESTAELARMLETTRKFQPPQSVPGYGRWTLTAAGRRTLATGGAIGLGAGLGLAGVLLRKTRRRG